MPLPTVLVGIVQKYFDCDTPREAITLPASAPPHRIMLDASVHLALAAGCMPRYIGCNGVYYHVRMNLPATILGVRLWRISTPMNLDLSRMRQLKNFFATDIYFRPDASGWMDGLSKCTSVEQVNFAKVSADGQISVGPLPNLRKLDISELYSSVIIEGGENLAGLSISHATRPLSIKGLNRGVLDLGIDFASGDYDFSGLPSALRYIFLDNLASFDLALLVDLPEDLHSLSIYACGAVVRWAGHRANRVIARGSVGARPAF